MAVYHLCFNAKSLPNCLFQGNVIQSGPHIVNHDFSEIDQCFVLLLV